MPETPISPESGLADDPSDPDRVWNHMIKQGLIAEDDFGRLGCSSCGLKLKQGRAALVRHVRSKHMKSCPLCHLDFVDLDSHLAAHNHDYAKGNEGLLDGDDMELELVHNLPEVSPDAENLNSKQGEEESGTRTEKPVTEQLVTTSPSHIEESLLDINPADVGKTWEELAEQNLVREELGHKKPFICILCNYMVGWKQHLIAHVRSVHFKLRDFKCSKCEKEYSNPNDLKKHVDKHHPEEPKRSLDPTAPNRKQTDQALGNQSDDSAEKELQPTNPSHPDSGILDLKPEDVEKTWKELVEQNLVRQQGGEKPFACNLCVYEVRSKYKFKLIEHVRSVHYKLKDYKCPKCEKEFQTALGMKIHVDKHHPGAPKESLDPISPDSKQTEQPVGNQSDDSNMKEPQPTISSLPNNNKMDPDEVEKTWKELVEQKLVQEDKASNMCMCTMCGLQLKGTKKYNLIRHVRKVHYKLKDAKCLKCEATFLHHKQLKKHMTEQHRDNQAQNESISSEKDDNVVDLATALKSETTSEPKDENKTSTPLATSKMSKAHRAQGRDSTSSTPSKSIRKKDVIVDEEISFRYGHKVRV